MGRALGDPAGPPIVLLPGLTDGLHPVWRAPEVYDALPAPMERCDGLVLSYRDPLPDQATTQRLAEDVAAVLARWREEPVVVIAHSMGTMVAQHLAAGYPELVAGLVLSAPLLRADAAAREVLGRWEELVRAEDWTGFAVDAARSSYTGSERERRIALARALPPEPPHPSLRTRHLHLSAACLEHDGTEVVEAIRAPTLLLAGEEDPVSRPEQAEELRARLGNARLHRLPGLAHGFPEQAAGPFSSLVTQFLGEVAAASRWGARDGGAASGLGSAS